MYFDAHCHLDLMKDDELTTALTSAKKADVQGYISCATNFATNEKNLALAQKYPDIKAALGLYPLDALELSNEELDRAFEYITQNISKAHALGEIGLDFKFSKSEEEHTKQTTIFARFIALSNKYHKPLVIHSRFAQRQVLHTLKEHNATQALLHSFVDSSKLMQEAVSLGYFVSVGLSVLWNADVQKNITKFPLEYLLFETDAPIRFNDEKAYPEKIPLIAQKVAELKSISLKEVEAQQEKNFTKLFGENI